MNHHVALRVIKNLQVIRLQERIYFVGSDNPLLNQGAMVIGHLNTLQGANHLAEFPVVRVPINGLKPGFVELICNFQWASSLVA